MAVKSNLLNMSLVLTLVCLVCSAVLGGAYVITKDPIAAAAVAKTNKAIAAVLPSFDEAVKEEVDGYVCYKAVKDDETVGEVAQNRDKMPMLGGKWIK